MPRARPEPRAARGAWSLPALRVRAGATQAAMVERFEEVLAAHLRQRSSGLEALVEAARAAGRDPAGWSKLIASVAAKVEFQRQGTAPGSPRAAVRDGKGDRATVLWYIARRAGVPACLVRWRPQTRTPSYGTPDPRDYSASAVRLRLRSAGGAPRHVWVDPGVDGGLLDYLRPGVRGREALLLGCDRPADKVAITTPTRGAAKDRRDIRAELVWHADGRVDAVVTDDMGGSLAALVRAYVRAGDSHRQQLLDQLRRHALPGGKATWVGVRGLDDPAARLVLSYRVELPADGHTTRASIGLFPSRLGRIYAHLSRRRTALRFAHSVDTRVQLVIDNRGAPWATTPTASASGDPSASFQRLVDQRGRVVTVSSRIRATMGIIPPERYPALARSLRAIDKAEIVHLRRGAAK